jgi:hypothetical protein
MQGKLFIKSALLIGVISCGYLTSFAQVAISAKDQAAVIRIFNTVDSRSWHIQFGNIVYGRRGLTATEKSQIKGIRDPGDKGIIIFLRTAAAIKFGDGSIIYISSATNSRTGTNHFLNLLGKTKAAQLKTIMAKYIEDPDMIDKTIINTISDPDR